jgi:TPR repeat protein
MGKSTTLVLVAGLLSGFAFAGEPAAQGTHAAHAAHASESHHGGMDSLWEVMWHQTGVPMRMVRWEQEMRVRIHGVDVAKHGDFIRTALGAISQETGVKVVDVSAKPEASANVSIELVPQTALEDAQPCVTVIDYKTETTIDSAKMQMRAGDARRCTYHELMHLMGLRGHPSGETVLSYFERRTGALLPLDKTMLRAWYSPQARAGMTPFEVLPLLLDEHSKTAANKKGFDRDRNVFVAAKLDQMRALADGTGDVPAIIKACGKISEKGVRWARIEAGYFLGLAYQQGASVPRDEAQAAKWMERAATMGHGAAKARVSVVTAS